MRKGNEKFSVDANVGLCEAARTQTLKLPMTQPVNPRHRMQKARGRDEQI